MHGPETPEYERETLRRCLQRYLADGDEDAMEEIIRRTRPALLRVARRIGAPQDAEDAVQSAYFSLLRKRGEKLDIPVLPWLKTAAIRIAYRQKALQQRQHEIARRLSRPRNGPTPLAEIASAEEAVRVRREVARLPATYRDPIVLRYLQGLTTLETSELLGVPEATVRTRLHRARALLRGRLPMPLRYGLAFVPWTLLDTARSVRNGLVQASVATTVPTPLALLLVLAASTTGSLLGAYGSAGRRGHSGGEIAPPPEAVRKSVATNERLDEEFRTESRRLEIARTRVATATTLLSVVRGEVRGLLGDAGVQPPGLQPGSRGRAPLRFAGFEEPLECLDWNLVGAAFAEMLPLLEDIGRVRDAGGNLEGTSPGRIQELNGILVQLTARMQARLGIPETSLTAVHPVFLTEIYAATLAAFGLPLDEEQARDIEAIARKALEEDEAADAGPGLEFELERRQRLANRRRRMLANVLAVLRPEQIRALRPAVTRGRLYADVLSSTHVWNEGTLLVCYHDESDLASTITERLSPLLDLAPSQREATHTLIEEWASTLPTSVRSAGDRLNRYGWVELSRVEEMVDHTLRLARTLITRAPLETKQIERLRRMRGPVVPIRLD